MLVRASAQGVVKGQPYVRTFDGSTGAADIVMSWGDGQAFAAIAADPSLARPEAFRPGAAEMAYRAQRPLMAYGAWLVSAGDGSRASVGILVLVVLGVTGAVSACALAGGGSARACYTAIAVLLVPGTLASMSGSECEPLALAFGALGAWWWLRPARAARAAVVAFALAVLTRETLIVVPVALALHEVVLHRRLRAIWLPVGAIAPWLVWLSIVVARLRVTPFDEGAQRLSAPFAGLRTALGRWGGDDITIALAIAILALAAVVLTFRHPFAWIVAMHVPLIAVLSADVWRQWEGFSRPLLPMCAFALLALADKQGNQPSSRARHEQRPNRNASPSR